MMSKNCLIGYGSPKKYEEWSVLVDELSFEEAEEKIEAMQKNEKLAIWLFNPMTFALTKICRQKIFDENN